MMLPAMARTGAHMSREDGEENRGMKTEWASMRTDDEVGDGDRAAPERWAGADTGPK